MGGGERHIEPLAFGRDTIFLSVWQIFTFLNAFNNYASCYFRKLNARLFSRADQLPEHRWECILILQKRRCARRMVLVSRRTRSSRNNDPPWMHNPSWSSHGGKLTPYTYHFDANNAFPVAIRACHPPQIYSSSPHQWLHCHCLGHDLECRYIFHH